MLGDHLDRGAAGATRPDSATTRATGFARMAHVSAFGALSRRGGDPSKGRDREHRDGESLLFHFRFLNLS